MPETPIRRNRIAFAAVDATCGRTPSGIGARPDPVHAKVFEVMRDGCSARFNGDPNYYDLVADRDKGMGGAQGPLYVLQDYLDIINAANYANLHLDDAEFDSDDAL